MNYAKGVLSEVEPGKSIYISVHSYGGWILLPWGKTAKRPPNFNSFEILGEKLAYFNRYSACNVAECLYLAHGNSEDWAYDVFKIPALTYELGSAFFQRCSDFENDVFPTNLKSLLHAFRIASNPFALSKGPDITKITTNGEDLTTGLFAAPVRIGPEEALTLEGQATTQMFFPYRGRKNKHMKDRPVEITWSFMGSRHQAKVPVDAQGSFLIRLPQLKKGEYYLSLSAKDDRGDTGPQRVIGIFVE